jgi:hypothetical protein
MPFEYFRLSSTQAAERTLLEVVERASAAPRISHNLWRN